MHMAHNRLLVFARKPAPVQACWLAYPGTTGLSAIDYRITDSHLDPPGLHDRCYAEESIRLPDTFWCYDPLNSEPAVNALPAAEGGYVAFGCLNNFCKVNPLVLKLWARVLNAVDRSRLTILAGEGAHRRHAIDLLAEEGVAGDRVTFVAHQPRQQYLRYYHGIDIGLDTVPYNGHTTSLDSFWMGVSVVTLVGPTVVGRAGLCQLTNLGLPELIASSPEQYVRIAVELARRPAPPGRFACDPAAAHAKFSADGCPAVRAKHRGGLPRDVAVVVREVRGFTGFPLPEISRRPQLFFSCGDNSVAWQGNRGLRTEYYLVQRS